MGMSHNLWYLRVCEGNCPIRKGREGESCDSVLEVVADPEPIRNAPEISQSM